MDEGGGCLSWGCGSLQRKKSFAPLIFGFALAATSACASDVVPRVHAYRLLHFLPSFLSMMSFL